MPDFLDQLFMLLFAAARTAIFDVGSLMAVLMLAFGVIDYRMGGRIRDTFVRRHLDKPVLMTLFALIPADGTLLFEYSLYRRGSIRFGSLTAGILGIGEEATYLVISYNPLAFALIAAIKLVSGAVTGSILNRIYKSPDRAAALRAADAAATVDEDVIKADENFHELPDKFRHKLHHFRYHVLGSAFWIFFAVCLALNMLLAALERMSGFQSSRIEALGIPLFDWLAMVFLLVLVIYRIIVRFTTREFGKIFEHEFEDQLDAIGDLAETCATVILLIFIMTFFVDAAVFVVGLERIAVLLQGKAIITILLGAVIGLVPGTGASLAFTTLYFRLAGTAGALPFAALLACSVALIGDSQFIGVQMIPKSQKLAHLIAFGVAIVVGLVAQAVVALL